MTRIATLVNHGSGRLRSFNLAITVICSYGLIEGSISLVCCSFNSQLSTSSDPFRVRNSCNYWHVGTEEPNICTFTLLCLLSHAVVTRAFTSSVLLQPGN